jgi:ketosteroid isomerase-like protein
MTGSESKPLQVRRWWFVPTVVALVTAVVPLATASSAGNAGAGVRAAAFEDPIVTDTRKLIDRFVQLWNANKLDELVAGHYVEDAVMLPPNHEPIRGRTAILTYIKRYRDLAGEFDKDHSLIRATPSGNQVSWVGQSSLRGGRIRITSHELFVRQPDGSMRSAVDMFGYRDPMR